MHKGIHVRFNLLKKSHRRWQSLIGDSRYSWAVSSHSWWLISLGDAATRVVIVWFLMILYAPLCIWNAWSFLKTTELWMRPMIYNIILKGLLLDTGRKMMDSKKWKRKHFICQAQRDTAPKGNLGQCTPNEGLQGAIKQQASKGGVRGWSSGWFPKR